MSLFRTTKCDLNLAAKSDYAHYVITAMGKPAMVYVCRRTESNGRIDPAYLLAAHAIEEGEGKAFAIITNYEQTAKWKTAFAGINNLAVAQQKSLTCKNAEADLPSNRMVIEVELNVENSDPPARAEPIIDNIFVQDPDGKYGTRSIPRLYMMAAITVEAKNGASVVALIVDQKGTIMSQGMKFHGEGGCGHAEVRAIFKLQGKLPASGVILSTLKPCTMCAGLINALDESDSLIKYWARDDAAVAANWNTIKLQLSNAHILDKGCTDAKFLKLAEGKDFSTEFEKARTAATEAANKTPNKADYFAPWLKAWQPPTGVSFVKRNPADPNKGALVNAGGQEARTIKESVSNMNELYKRLAKGIAPSGNVQGLDNSQQKAITEKFDTYFKQKSKEAAPSMGTIEFINKGKGSAVLRTAAIEVLKAKRQKLQDAQYGTAQSPPKQQNNKIVLEYLALYLQGMGCGL